VKFSVITIYPNSIFAGAINWQSSWELVASAVEYLFMGYFSLNQRLDLQSNHGCEYTKINLLDLAEPKLDYRSGRYRDSVPK
jgi:hypothetical protein